MQCPESTSHPFDKKLTLVTLITGAVLLVLFHLRLTATLPQHRLVANSILLVIYLCLLLAGLAGWWIPRIFDWINRILVSGGRIFGISASRFLLQLFAFLFTITATIACGFKPIMYDALVSVLAWGGAIVLCIFAGWEEGSTAGRVPEKAILWAIALFLIAFLFRGFDTTIYPNALGGDEASSGIYSATFRDGKTNNLFIAGWFSFPSLFSFIQSWSIRLLGQTTQGLRVLSAVVGSLTVLVTYLVTRAMFGNRSAVMASILLAFSHFHIHFSRLGLNNIWDGFWWVATVGALWWAWKQERTAAFTLAGICLGLSQYFYTSTRGMFGAIPVWLVLAAIFDRQRFLRLWPQVLRVFLVAGIVSLPLAWFYINKPVDFQAPLLRVTIFGNWMSDTQMATGKSVWLILVQQFTASILGITQGPLKLWYMPGCGILRSVAAGLFYVSLAIFILQKYKDNRLWLIFLWLGLIITGGALSKDTPAAQRYVAAAPPVMMIIGYGIEALIEFLAKRLPGNRKLISIAAQLLVLYAAFGDVWFYFYDYSPMSDFGGRHTQIAQRLATYLHQYDSSWEVMFVGRPEMGYDSINSLTYLNPQIKGVTIPYSWGNPRNPKPTKKNVMFVFLPTKKEDIKLCLEQYPGGELIEEHDMRQILYYLYKVNITNIPDAVNSVKKTEKPL